MRTFVILKNLLKWKLLGKRVPLKATFDLTNRCNLDCRFCTVDKKSSDDMPLDFVLYLLRCLRKSGLEVASFSGGEPLLRKDIKPIIEECKKMGVRTVLSTNGILLKARFDDIKDVDLFSVSLDGTRKVNDAIRGPGVYDRAVGALKFLKEKEKQCFVTFTLTPDNLDDAGPMIDLVQSLGVGLSIQPVYGTATCRGPETFKSINKTTYLGAIDRIIECKKRGGNITNSHAYLKMLKKYPDHNHYPCHAGATYLFVSHSGELKCCMHDPEGIRLTAENLKDSMGRLDFGKKCWGCYMSCYLEYNLVFSFNADSCFNMLGKYF